MVVEVHVGWIIGLGVLFLLFAVGWYVATICEISDRASAALRHSDSAYQIATTAQWRSEMNQQEIKEIKEGEYNNWRCE